MDFSALSAMFLLGFFGSAHCLGMCGPLVLSLPGGPGRFVVHLLYHCGRLSTYTLVGLLLGSLGGGLAGLAHALGADPLQVFSRIQLAVSLFSALFLGCFGLIRLGVLREPTWMSSAMPSRLPGFTAIRAGVIVDRNTAGCYLYGIMLGFLPCGLSYAAFAAALAAGSPLRGALATLCFGLGTLPSLLLLGTAAGTLLRRHQRLCELLAGLLMLGMALSLLSKGVLRLL